MGTFDAFVGAEELGPALLQDHDPSLDSVGRLAAHEAAVLPAAGEVVVDHHLPQDALLQHSHHVDPVLVDLQVREDLGDARLFLG